MLLCIYVGTIIWMGKVERSALPRFSVELAIFLHEVLLCCSIGKTLLDLLYEERRASWRETSTRGFVD